MTFDPGYHAGTTLSGIDEMNQINAQPSPEQLRDYIINEMQTADEVVSRQTNGNLFVKNHPEFKDTQANGHLMTHELKVRGYWPNPSYANFEEVYFSLAQDNLLALHQDKIDAQRAQELDEQAAKIRAEAFDEETAYALPLNEVARRAGGVGR